MPATPVFLHIGLMKTGTSFLQSTYWASESALSAQGLSLVPPSKIGAFHLMLDVRERYNPTMDPISVTTALSRLPRQLSAMSGTRALISQESLSTATPGQIARLRSTLESYDVHVVITARDIARQIPSSWQQSVQAGGLLSFGKYVDAVVRHQGHASRRFWQGQSIVEVAGRWADAVPPERMHLVIVPPSGSPAGVLLSRYSQLLGVDPDTLRLDAVRRNSSLGLVQTELLRQVNTHLPEYVGRRDLYGDVGKRYFAASILGPQTSQRALLPRRLEDWCCEHATRVFAELGESGYDVVGDLAELMPSTESFAVEQVDVVESDVIESAATALATILGQRMAELDERRSRRRRLATRARSPARVSRRLRAAVRTALRG